MKFVFRFLSVLLGILIFTQSCATYTGNYSLDQAVAANKKAKVKTIDQKPLTFDKIDTLNGEYIGVKIDVDKVQHTILEEALVERIRLQNDARVKSNATITNIFLLTTAITLFIAYLVNEYNEFVESVQD